MSSEPVCGVNPRVPEVRVPPPTPWGTVPRVPWEGRPGLPQACARAPLPGDARGEAGICREGPVVWGEAAGPLGYPGVRQAHVYCVRDREGPRPPHGLGHRVPRRRGPPSASRAPGPWRWGRLACSRPSSHAGSVQSPGVANSGLGQLCGGAEAAISGPENSCPERPQRPVPRAAHQLPGGPPGTVPPPTPVPSRAGGHAEPPRGCRPAGRGARRRLHLQGLPPALCAQDRAAWGGRPGPRSRGLGCLGRKPASAVTWASSGELEMWERSRAGG